jgi:RNA polymerase sigma-70 factor (ECF subfamily)
VRGEPDICLVVERRRRFERIFDENLRTVHAYVLRRTRPAEVDDAVAEVFLVAWRRIDDVPADAKPWLLGVARRVLANQRRAADRRASLAQRTRVELDRPPDDAADAPPILRALHHLSARDREILMLIAWDGVSFDEAAAILGCSRGAAKVRFHRGRRRLACVLAELDVDDTLPAARLKLEAR